MRIEDIVNITDAELLNQGYIKEILGFASDINDVKREYLFASNNIDDIQEAIKKGAYAILCDKDIKILDKEIAWIQVDSLKEAFLKLLKYKLLNNTLYYTDEITFDIIKSINRDKRLVLLENEDFNMLNGEVIYLTKDLKYKKISLESQELTKTISIQMLHSTPFLLDILYKKKYSLIFPKLYFSNLEIAVSFFEDLKLAYHLKDVKIDRFYPQFINSRYEKLPFGKTNRVVIQGLKTDKYLINELNYIFENLKYAIVKFYDKNNIDFFYKEYFNFAVLIDCEVKLKEKEIKEISLF